MKGILRIFPAIFLFLLVAAPYAPAADRHNEGTRHEGRGQERRFDSDRDRDNFRGYYDRDRDRDYEYRNPGMRPRGYRSEAHGHHLGNGYFHNYREYHSEGHWNSWDDWERYRERYAERFRDGRYYREEGRLFFQYCDPADGVCFFFSIGR